MADDGPLTIKVQIDTTILDKLVAEARPRASQIVNKYGLVVASEAARTAPYDTGALQNSVLSESHMADELTYIVQDGVTYGVYQELGTYKMRAHPFMMPALMHWAERFVTAFMDLVDPNWRGPR